MFTFLKKILSSSFRRLPNIVPLDFSDGLLAFRCQSRLPFESVLVTTETSTGRVPTRVEVCSYDASHQIYRAHISNSTETLRKLEIVARGTARLEQSVRVSSRQIPQYFALTEDVSASGLRLATPQALAVGSTLDMTVDLDDPAIPTLTVHGEVCWTADKLDGSCHSGIRFVGIDRAQYRMLERYIEGRLEAQRAVHGAF